MTRGPSAIALFLLCLAVASAAQSRFLGECDITFESGRFEGPTRYPWAIRLCGARESVFLKWDAKLEKLDTGWTELQRATSAADWATYRSKWAELLPLMQELEAAAGGTHRSAAGAGRVLGLYRTDLGARLHQAGSGAAANLDASSARILAALNVARASVAAGIGVEAVLESKQLGHCFVLGVAAAESDKVLSEYRAQARQRR